MNWEQTRPKTAMKPTQIPMESRIDSPLEIQGGKISKTKNHYENQ